MKDDSLKDYLLIEIERNKPMALFKFKDIEFERTDSAGKTTYFVKSDGTPATLFEKICLISIAVVLGFCYVAFRILIGVMFVAIAMAAMVKVSLHIPFINALHLLLDNSSVTALILLIGSIVGLGVWISDSL